MKQILNGGHINEEKLILEIFNFTLRVDLRHQVYSHIMENSVLPKLGNYLETFRHFCGFLF